MYKPSLWHIAFHHEAEFSTLWFVVKPALLHIIAPFWSVVYQIFDYGDYLSLGRTNIPCALLENN